MIEISINGERIFFASATCQKSISTAAGSFAIKIGGEPLKYSFGDAVQIFSNGKMIINGKIEHIKAVKNKNVDEIIYSGRDNTGDFIDSYFDKVVEFNRSLNLEKIIETIASPFGLSVTSEVSIQNFTVGELPTAYAGQRLIDFCNQLCQIRSVLLTATSDGNLLITDEGKESNSTPIIFGAEYANAFERLYESDKTKEFDRYIVYSQNNSILDDLNNLVNVKAQTGSGKRIKTLIENNSLNVGECLSRANFESELDIRRSTRYTAKIAGDVTYYPNQKVSVKDSTLDIDETMIIVAMKWNYSKDSDDVEIVLEKIP